MRGYFGPNIPADHPIARIIRHHAKRCPSRWTTQKLSVSTSHAVGRQIGLENMLLRTFMKSSGPRILKGNNMSRFLSGDVLLATFQILPGLTPAAVSTFLQGKMDEIALTFEAVSQG